MSTFCSNNCQKANCNNNISSQINGIISSEKMLCRCPKLRRISRAIRQVFSVFRLFHWHSRVQDYDKSELQQYAQFQVDLTRAEENLRHVEGLKSSGKYASYAKGSEEGYERQVMMERMRSLDSRIQIATAINANTNPETWLLEGHGHTKLKLLFFSKFIQLSTPNEASKTS